MMLDDPPNPSKGKQKLIHDEARARKSELERQASEALQTFRTKQKPVTRYDEEWKSSLLKDGRFASQAREIRAEDLNFYLSQLATLQIEADKYEFPEKLNPTLEANCTALCVIDEFQLSEGLILPKVNAEFICFQHGASFANAVFSGFTNFFHAVFLGKDVLGRNADFSNASFSSMVSFDAASFPRHTSFSRAKFSTVIPVFASFCDAKFSGETSFSEAEFMAGVGFSGSVFLAGVEFDRAKFPLGASFKNTVFFPSAYFKYVEIDVFANFQGCRFYGAPIFHNAKLPQDTNFHKSRFEPPKSGAQQLLEWSSFDYRAFRTLKLLMAGLRAQQEEAMFFAHELRVQRIVEYRPFWFDRRMRIDRSEYPGKLGRPFLWFLSWFYDIVSRYGQSPARAFWMFFLWNATFGLLYWVVMHWGPDVWAMGLCMPESWCLGVPSRESVAKIAVASHALVGSEAVALSMQNAFNPIALLSEKALVTVQNGSVLAASLLQAIGSLAILALLLLAIRARFQKGSGGGGS